MHLLVIELIVYYLLIVTTIINYLIQINALIAVKPIILLMKSKKLYKIFIISILFLVLLM